MFDMRSNQWILCHNCFQYIFLFFITLTVRSLISPNLNEKKNRKREFYFENFEWAYEYVWLAISHRVMKKWIAPAKKVIEKQETQNYTTFNSAIHNNLNSDILSHCANLTLLALAVINCAMFWLKIFGWNEWVVLGAVVPLVDGWWWRRNERNKKNRQSSRRNVWEVREIKKKQKATP